MIQKTALKTALGKTVRNIRRLPGKQMTEMELLKRAVVARSLKREGKLPRLDTLTAWR